MPTMTTMTAFLLTFLTIFPSILSNPIEPRKWGHEIDSGVLTSDYVEGFIGERPYTGPDGDYVRATFCYCATPMDQLVPLVPRQFVSWGNRDGQHGGEHGGIQPGELIQGHYWRYEYYNYHNNATYFLNHYCLEDMYPQDKHGCGYDSPGKFAPAPDSYWHMKPYNDYALGYGSVPGHERHSWTIYKKDSDVDWIMYGRGNLLTQQKRRLAEDQGLIEMPREWVEEKCNHYCDTELLLPMDTQLKSHGELYNDVDDMCDRCA